MYKKLREIFNWFQQKAIRRMNLKNVLNEYYYRMDSSGLPTSGTMYKRQAVVYREKTIDDWIMSVTAATDPDDPRRGLLYRFFQSLYNDEHLQTTIDNRVLPVQQAKYNLVDDNDNEDEEAKKLLDRPWFHQLIRICFLHQLQGVSLADLSHLDDNLEISHVEEIPMSNYIPQQQIIIREEINKLAYTFEFDHEEVAKKTGLPIIGQKKNPGGEQQGGTLPNQPQTDPQKKRPNRTMKR